MSLKRLRINYGDGTKIIALKSDGLPRTFYDLVGLIVGRVSALSSVDESLLTFTYLDGDGVTEIDVEDDSDLEFMFETFETSDIVVLNVKRQEPT
ncbi:hypothetical protein HDU93_003150, partial [Gonapodya sp. JEL0774]